jgi:hypothetical protein
MRRRSVSVDAAAIITHEKVDTKKKKKVGKS